uniref:Uncharacterized protein n=1 Tax=Takifugu rubripes TaxID=31033 RepID=A0A674NCZ0_TAKRU
TFHTARLSVESCAANVGRSDAASFTQRAEASSAEPSYLLSSTQQKVLHGRKKKTPQVSLPHTTVATVTGAGAHSLWVAVLLGVGAGRPREPRQRLMSYASCGESTHRSISICFCASPWLSPLPQVEKNGGVHRTMRESELGGGRGGCTCASVCV